MTLKSKLERLEIAVASRGTSDMDEPEDDEQWLVKFRQWADAGLFDHAPGFQHALAAYAQAVEEAELRADWEPSASFLPSSDRLSRLSSWRSLQRFPVVDAAWCRLADMLVPAAA